ncbi:MAG: CobW family GTP-binding protein [Acidimicrobiales bacterium]
MSPPIALTVVGGYLGAGKTTLLNRLLSGAHGRRLGVIVNDFGDLAIDATLLADAAGGDGVVNLPNGCVCCTLGTGLMDALARMAELDPPPDQVVIEASGVADPAAVAAWAHTEPFRPGGVIVLAGADSIDRQIDDRVIGRSVRTQLDAADLVVVSKADRVDAATLAAVAGRLAARTGAPLLTSARGDVDPELILTIEGAADRRADGPTDGHTEPYRAASWRSATPVDPALVETFVAELDPRVLRLKGWVHTTEGDVVDVQVVGRNRWVGRSDAPRPASQLVAIWIGDDIDDVWARLPG